MRISQLRDFTTPAIETHRHLLNEKLWKMGYMYIALTEILSWYQSTCD